jgi:hypothetical protein
LTGKISKKAREFEALKKENPKFVKMEGERGCGFTLFSTQYVMFGIMPIKAELHLATALLFESRQIRR